MDFAIQMAAAITGLCVILWQCSEQPKQAEDDMRAITTSNLASVLKSTRGNEREPQTKPRRTKPKAQPAVREPRRPKLQLHELRPKPVEARYLLLSLDLETLIDGPFTNLDLAVSKTIECRRDGVPCRLIAATLEVPVSERWTDNLQEAGACDYR